MKPNAKIYDKYIDNRYAKMDHFQATFDAYGGNEKTPLSIQDGARLYFISATSRLNAVSQLSDENEFNPILSKQIELLFDRVKTYVEKEPSIVDNSVDIIPGQPRDTIKSESELVGDFFQNAIQADRAFSLIHVSVNSKLLALFSAVNAVVMFLKLAKHTEGIVKKSAKVKFDDMYGVVFISLQNALRLHRQIAVSTTLIYATADAFEFEADIVFNDYKEAVTSLVNEAYEELEKLDFERYPKQELKAFDRIRGAFKKLATPLNLAGIRDKLKQHLIETNFEYVNYLGATYDDEIINLFENDINDIYDGFSI